MTEPNSLTTIPMTFLIEDDIIRDLAKSSAAINRSMSEVVSSILRKWSKIKHEHLPSIGVNDDILEN